MAEEISSPLVTYKLGGLNAVLNREKRQRLLVGIAISVLLSVLTLAIAMAKTGNLSHGASNNSLVFIGILACTAVGSTAIWVRAIPSMRPGLESLGIDNGALILTYAGRTPIVCSWTDPMLSFSLWDYRSTNPSQLLAPTPFQLEMSGRNSVISQEAYDAILRQTESHHLLSEDVALGFFDPRPPLGPKVVRFHSARTVA
jgi:hypothetical protein